jgi:hypothetical protein
MWGGMRESSSCWVLGSDIMTLGVGRGGGGVGWGGVGAAWLAPRLERRHRCCDAHLHHAHDLVGCSRAVLAATVHRAGAEAAAPMGRGRGSSSGPLQRARRHCSGCSGGRKGKRRGTRGGIASGSIDQRAKQLARSHCTAVVGVLDDLPAFDRERARVLTAQDTLFDTFK